MLERVISAAEAAGRVIQEIRKTAWPEDADVTIDTADVTPEEAAQQIILHLEREG